MLAVENLTKRFGTVTANANISFSAQRGEIIGIVGPNGAGKTTLLNQIAGLVRIDDGNIRVGDIDVAREPLAVRSEVVFQPQSRFSIDDLTPFKAVCLAARFRGMTRGDARQRAKTLFAALDIERYANIRSRTLSGGVLRLVTFCMTISHPGALVVLDEPTNDVDPMRRQLLWNMLRQTNQHAAVLVVTHNVLEAEKACTKLLVLGRGRVLALGTPLEIRGASAQYFRLHVYFDDSSPAPAAPAYLIPVQTEEGGQRYKVEREHGSEALAWADRAQASNLLTSYSFEPASIQDSYEAILRGETGRTS